MRQDIKLTWHDGNQVWTKVIGKRLSKARDRLVQAQWYFTANRQESESLAAARRAEWRKLVKGWSGHRVLLDVMDEPFPDVPHWDDDQPRRGAASPPPPPDTSKAETIEALRRESEPTQSEVAQMYEDMDVAECAALFMLWRKQREGVDFTAPTNKSHKTDLNGALCAIDTQVRMVDLTPSHLEDQRQRLIRRCHSANTARNYGRAMRMMLDWYYGSPYSFGLTEPKGIAEVFGRYPKKRPAKPKHIPLDTLKTVMQAATERRRLYMLLMLNTGMQPTDIPALRTTSFDLDASVVKWYRQKNERVRDPSGHEITSRLWPETVETVRRFLCSHHGPAFRNVMGQPLSHDSASSNRQNAVAKALAKFFQKVKRDHGIEVSAKNFRQTGAQLIHHATGDYDLSQIWLGRKFKMVDRPYLTEVYDRLVEATLNVRDKLVAADVLSSCRKSPISSRRRNAKKVA